MDHEHHQQIAPEGAAGGACHGRQGPAGLPNDSIADPEIGKHTIGSMEGVSGGCRAMVSPETPCAEAFIGDPRRPFPLAPASLAVSKVPAVIPAPSRAVATVECDRG